MSRPGGRDRPKAQGSLLLLLLLLPKPGRPVAAPVQQGAVEDPDEKIGLPSYNESVIFFCLCIVYSFKFSIIYFKCKHEILTSETHRHGSRSPLSPLSKTVATGCKKSADAISEGIAQAQKSIRSNERFLSSSDPSASEVRSCLTMVMGRLLIL